MTLDITTVKTTLDKHTQETHDLLSKIITAHADDATLMEAMKEASVKNAKYIYIPLEIKEKSKGEWGPLSWTFKKTVKLDGRISTAFVNENPAFQALKQKLGDLGFNVEVISSSALSRNNLALKIEQQDPAAKAAPAPEAAATPAADGQA
jgi:hypothetical protein